MSFWKWSRTAANNATADGSINWAEGQAPSTVNDSARAMMAAASKYRDDVGGAIATAGTGTANIARGLGKLDPTAHGLVALMHLASAPFTGGLMNLAIAAPAPRMGARPGTDLARRA
jgi:prophage DNA circulation protein